MAFTGDVDVDEFTAAVCLAQHGTHHGVPYSYGIGYYQLVCFHCYTVSPKFFRKIDPSDGWERLSLKLVSSEQFWECVSKAKDERR